MLCQLVHTSTWTIMALRHLWPIMNMMSPTGTPPGLSD